jgi:hypothetical protein
MRQTTLPDYHFLYFAPSLGAEWFFDAARRYYEVFQPTVLNDFEFLSFVPESASLIVTTITRRDTVEQIGVEIAQARPGTVYDPVVQDLFADMKTVLNDRAARNWPFGVPLAPTPDTRVNPTPGSILGGGPPAPTRQPGGFVTQTPTPAQPVPLPTQPPGSTPQGPIAPTPGPILGG